jgi:hypothetical protein
MFRVTLHNYEGSFDFAQDDIVGCLRFRAAIFQPHRQFTSGISNTRPCSALQP